MADFSTPQLVVTDVGLAVASQATPVGPFVHITGFRIGSAYGYNPQPTDTNINGQLLYQGTPTSYRYMGDNTLAVICEMPATAGPFEFGEVAIDLDGGVMFAKAAFAEPQIKYTSLNTNVLSTYTFNCLIKLDQSVAVFQVNTLCGPPEILEVEAWTDVMPPFLGGTTSLTPALIVKEPTPNGEATMIFQSNDHHWTVGAPYQHVYIGHCQPSGTPQTVVNVNIPDLMAFDPTLIPYELVTNRARDFVIEDNQGNIRAVANVTINGAQNENLAFTLTAPFPAPGPAGGTDVFIHTVKPLTHVALSGDSGNLLEKRNGGLYYGIQAPPNLQDLFIDAVNGDDNNSGTRAEPMRTIQAALARGSQGLNRNIHLYEQQTHYVDPNNRAEFRGGVWNVVPYGPQCDQLPTIGGDSPFMGPGAVALSPIIQALPFRVVNSGGTMLQQADALVPLYGANVIAFDIIFECGVPANGDPVNQNGSFHDPYGEGFWFLRNCEVHVPNALSSFGSNYIIAPFQIQTQAFVITGPGKLFTADNTAMTYSYRSGSLSSRNMSPSQIMPYINNAAFAAPVFYNFNTNLKPSDGGLGGGTLQKVSVGYSYTMPNDRIGFYIISRHEMGSPTNNAFMYVNGVQIAVIDTGDSEGFFSTYPLNPGDTVQITGSTGGQGITTTWVLLYPAGVTSWN